VAIPKIEGDGVAEIRSLRGAMIGANIAKALEGSYLHLKALLEYAGLWPAESMDDSGDSSLAALLFKSLETEEHPAIEEGREMKQNA